MAESDGYEGEDEGGSTMWIWILVAVLAGFCLIGIAVVGIMAAVTMPALLEAKSKANRTQCANKLRQLGLGAIMYGDDKRFFPHVGNLTELDGGAETSDGPRTLRALMNMGYVDDPEVYICPESYDLHFPTAPNQDRRQWFWSGDTRMDPSADPLTDGMPDPTLLETTELSYGWTRRALNMGARSSTPLGADRAIRADVEDEVGNHSDGVNVVHVDASVRFIEEALEPNAFEELIDGTNQGQLGLVPR